MNDQQAKGRENLLMLDASEEIGTTSQSIAVILSEFSLIDNLMQFKHPSLQSPVTYNRGSKK